MNTSSKKKRKINESFVLIVLKSVSIVHKLSKTVYNVYSKNILIGYFRSKRRQEIIYNIIYTLGNDSVLRLHESSSALSRCICVFRARRVKMFVLMSRIYFQNDTIIFKRSTLAYNEFMQKN